MSYPRTPVRARTDSTSAALGTPPIDPPSSPFSFTTPKEEHSAPRADNGGDPPEALFPGVVTTLITPTPSSEKLAPELKSLYNHLATSFVPTNQPASSHKVHDTPSGKVFVPTDRGSEDPVIALVSPMEGGDVYNAKAVHDVAAQLDADVVRLDLALGIGFDGPSAPLAETGKLGYCFELQADDQVLLRLLSQYRSTPCSKLKRPRRRTSISPKLTRMSKAWTETTTRTACPT